jgi:hypothetical protein
MLGTGHPSISRSSRCGGNPQRTCRSHLRARSLDLHGWHRHAEPCPLMALLGPREMSDLSPQSGPKRMFGSTSLISPLHHCNPSSTCPEATLVTPRAHRSDQPALGAHRRLMPSRPRTLAEKNPGAARGLDSHLFMPLGSVVSSSDFGRSANKARAPLLYVRCPIG